MNARIIVALFLTAFPIAEPPAGLTIVRWQMVNEKYYTDLTPNAGNHERKVFRFKRAEARDDDLGRCEREVERRSARSKWCQAFAYQLTPSFRFVLSDDPGPVVIDSVVVHVHDVQRLLGGRGFLEDEAGYDIRIKAEKGSAQSIPLRKPLEFTGLGTIDLRLGFDLSAYGPKPPPVRIDFSLTFRRSNLNGGEVTSPAIRLEM